MPYVPDPRLLSFAGTVEGVDWPPIATDASATIGLLVHRLDRTQWLEPEALEARQRIQLRTTARWFAQHSPRVARIFAAAGIGPDDLGAPGGLQALPILRRTDLVRAEDDEQFGCAPPPSHRPTDASITSGSTGTPVTVQRTRATATIHAACSVRAQLWHDLDVGAPIAAVRHGPAGVERHPTWGQPTDLLWPTGPSLALPVELPVDEVFDELERFQPVNLLCYPTVLGAIAAEVEAGRRALSAIRRIETLGETLDDDVRDAVARAGPSAMLRDLYSSQEAGLLAAECAEGGVFHVMAEHAVVEVLDDAGAPVAPGEVGHVVVTDLHNLATPIIRYEQGDLAERGGPCACGRGLPTLVRVRGRQRNLLRLADGTAFFPIFGVPRYRSVAPVLQQQVVQHDVATLEVRLVTEAALTAEQEGQLRDIITDSIGHQLTIRFTYHDRIERGPTGKYEEFISLVRPE